MPAPISSGSILNQVLNLIKGRKGGRGGGRKERGRKEGEREEETLPISGITLDQRARQGPGTRG